MFSTLKLFLHSMMSVLGIVVGLFISFLLISPMLPRDHLSSFTADVTGTGDKVIVKISIDGMIAAPVSSYIEEVLSVSSNLGDKLGGILLVIDSPGGVIGHIESIYHMLDEYKGEIPIHTHAKGLCASGGYYLASISDEISAAPSAIIGSVGVIFSPMFNFYKLMQIVGIESEVIYSGKYKEKFPSYTELSGDESYQDLLEISKESYQRFVNAVERFRSAHGLTKNKLVNELGAKIFSSRDALTHGYIDRIEPTTRSSISHLADSIGLSEGGYKVISFTQKESFSSLIKREIGKVYSSLMIPDGFFLYH